MEKPNILNTLNILQKVEMGENAIVLFYFGTIPDWNQNEFLYGIQEAVDYYEVIEVNFDLDHSDRVNLYWKIHRYIGERSFLTVENKRMSFWRGEITDYEEQWNYFDDLDDEIQIVNYKKYNIQKTLQDWKNDYKNLEKRFYSLYEKKRIQLDSFREKIKSELKNKIEKRLDRMLHSKKAYKNPEALTKDEVRQLMDLAFNDSYNGVRLDLFTEFLYDTNE